MRRLGAFIAIICSTLATGMAAWPAQAASIHAASSAASSSGPYYWQSEAGAQDYMTSYDNGVVVNPFVDAFEFEATGCETATGEPGTYTYCHYQFEGTDLCVSTYGVALYGQLSIENCGALGGGQQVDQLWWFDNEGDDMGFLFNYNGHVAYCGGDNGDPVDMGNYSGYTNNYWQRINA